MHQAALSACCIAAVLLVTCTPALGAPTSFQLLVELSKAVSAGSFQLLWICADPPAVHLPHSSCTSLPEQQAASV